MSSRQKKIITYGTFDLFHVGHVRLLKRIAALGDHLTVGVSSDEFNTGKGKKSAIAYEQRAEIVAACRYVDAVIPENAWDQKRNDISAYGINIFAMGDDWAGRFDDLLDLCEVVYLPRTDGISSTSVKSYLASNHRDDVLAAKHAAETLAEIIGRL